MTNELIALLLFIITVPLVFMTIYEYINRQRAKYIKYYFYANISLIIWVISYILFFVDNNPERIIFWHSFRYIGICLVPVFYAIFLYNYLNQTLYPKPRIKLYLFIIPAINIILALTNGWHDLFYLSRIITEYTPLKILDSSYSNIFYLHTAYSYALVVFIFIYTFIYIRKTPVLYRGPLYLFALGIFMNGFINFLNIMRVFPGSHIFDFSILGIIICNYLFFSAIFQSKTSDMMFSVKDMVFQKLSFVCLAMDINDNIIFTNERARSLFGFCGKLEEQPLQSILDMLIDKYDGSKSKTPDNNIIFHLSIDGKNIYLDFHKTDFIDNNNNKIGSFVEMRDVTLLQQTLHELERISITDNLTGIYNQRYFRKKLYDLDNEEYYPLLILVGDLNRLKETNDTYGHEWGDKMLIDISNILKDELPDNYSYVFRTGGDEFSVIITNSDEETACSYIDRVHDACFRNAVPDKYMLSISLGFSIKDNSAQDISSITKEADMNMYENKRQRVIKGSF